MTEHFKTTRFNNTHHLKPPIIHMSVAPIRVELEAFCNQFTSALKPYDHALENSSEALRRAKGSEQLSAVLSDLQDNRHRLKILLDRALQQNTYLVIFGPLKSGKSTLMNAVSGAYVSEVSSLPAYPCLVYVKEGEAHGFSATSFNGDQQEFSTRSALVGSLDDAHEALAQRIRQAETEGASFSPAQDFSEAIRRIDFTMPAPYLRESGTILVDTPGLYTKMKYDYGQLTREFRDTAACAVFVVKADNLFFEQVFEEFADLLSVFSRVFLVVNIDSSKQDLSPDGSLQPSLEQRDPQRIIDAFQDLTVNAGIRSAIDNGRLKIYLIDLLQTAARSLKENQEMTSEATAEEDPAGEHPAESDTDTADGEAAESAAAEDDATDVAATQHSQVGFDAFRSDLTDYLNSSEYIAEFMSDSLRQAHSILGEVKEAVETPEVQAFRDEIKELVEKSAACKRQLSTVDQLQDSNWEAPLEELSREIWQQALEHSGSVVSTLVKELTEEVKSWTDSDESMHDLVQERIVSKIKDACQGVKERSIELFNRACHARNGGIRISGEVSRQLDALDISFDSIYTTFQPTVDERLRTDAELPDASELQESLELRRCLVDWLLFRSNKRIRNRIFGSENPSTQSFPAATKSRRLTEDAISNLCGAVGDYTRRCFLENLESVLESLLREYREAFTSEAKRLLKTKRQALRDEAAELSQQIELRQKVTDALDALERHTGEFEADSEQLYAEFVPDRQPASPEQAQDLLESDEDSPEHTDEEVE